MSEKKLIELFNESKYYSLKYKNYFTIYEKLFDKYRNKKITFVEIGVLSGGSLKMWKKYFGERSRIIGIDLNPRAKNFENDEIDLSNFVINSVIFSTGTDISFEQIEPFLLLAAGINSLIFQNSFL